MAEEIKKEKATNKVKAKAPQKKFWEGIKAEFKKITWPDKELLMKQSVVVVCVSIVLGAVIAILDFFLQFGVDFITQL